MMRWIGKALTRLGQKAFSFSTVGYSRQALENWYRSNGYYGISDHVYSYSQNTALSIAALFGGVKIIGEDVGGLPLRLYERIDDENTRAATKHPLYRLLHDAPNDDTDAITFRESMTAQALLCGNAYALKGLNGDGEIVALWQIQPQDMVRSRRPDGSWQTVVNIRGRKETVAEDRLFILRGFAIDGMVGANTLELARRTLAIAVNQADYAHRGIAENQKPTFGLKFPGDLGGPEGIKNFKAAWKDYHSDPENWFAPAVLPEGGDVVQFGQTNEQYQLVEQRKFQILEVCRILRLSPHKLAALEDATLSNVGNLQIQHLNSTLRPWLVRWEQAINRQLIAENEKQKYYAEHSIEGFLRGDFKTQTEGFAKLLEKGVYSINEVRAFFNLNPIEGGDEHHIQLNMQAVGQAAGEAIDDEQNDSKLFVVQKRA